MTPLQQTGFPDLQLLTRCSAKDFLWLYPPAIQLLPLSSPTTSYYIPDEARSDAPTTGEQPPPFTSSCIYWAATQSHCLPLLLRSWQPHLRRLATGYFQTHVRAHGRARPRRYMPVAYPDTKPVPPVSFEFGATDLSFAGPLLLLNLAKSFSTSNENVNYRSLCRFLVNAHKTYCSAK